MLVQKTSPRADERRIDPSAHFEINPDLDIAALRQSYAEHRRVRVYGLLSRGAIPLHDELRGREDWIQLVSTDKGALELGPEERARLGTEGWARISDECLLRARTGFQYRYQGLRVPSEEERGSEDDLLSAFAALMESEPMLGLLRAITGHDEISFTDGQTTAYGPGDFLTGHDDDVAGKNRIAAYVFGLTQMWRLEWGGLLLFHGNRDRTAHALAPRFNVLDLFEVPQRHSVSEVTGAATHSRMAITGWLRAGERA